MATASYVQSSFLLGEVSKLTQGRLDRPDYRSMMNTCLNGFPLETGAWVRRPGTAHSAIARSGNPARVQSFDFKASAPYTVEFTDGFLRFHTAGTLAKTNDAQTISAISSASPAKVTTGTHGWSSNDQVYFSGLSTNNPLLHNRPFSITVTSSTEFTIADAVTGTAIDGSTLGSFVSGTVSRVLQVTSPYVGGTWAALRMVKADIPTSNATTPGAVVLHASIKPYVLQVSTAPTASAYATFSLAAAVFKDGPYFDPVPGGTLATPSATKGNITLQLAFPAYDSSKSYSVGDYVVSSSVNYKSLTDANVGNTPASSASNWVAVSAADAIGPNGFQGSDVGRHVRLFSEPAIWLVGTTYAAGDVVAYGGTGLRYDGATYWKALVGSNTGNVPGVDITKWTLFPTGALWTWGRITGFSNIINRALAGSASIGDMTSGGGLAALFDGVTSQAASASAEKSTGGLVAPVGPGSVLMLSSYGGKNYAAASDQVIAQAIVYPSTDNGLAIVGFNHPGLSYTISVKLNLRGKASAPSGETDGTVIGTTTVSNTTSPVTIVSTDQSTAWKYAWVEQITTITVTAGGATAYEIENSIAELSLFNPAGSGTSQGCTVQIVGDALLYTTAIRTWRLGLYSDTTGWPTCGTYHEGRLWLSGVIPNRLDASTSRDIFTFSPTEGDGSVTDANAIAYMFSAPDVNTILWMEPDQLGIVCGTAAGEWLVQASALNNPLTPTNIQAHRAMRHRCANIEPRRTGLTLTAVQAYKRSLLEFFHDTYSGKFAADHLTEDAKHLTSGNIAEIAFQQELAPIVWARKEDGTLIGVTYRRKTLTSSQRAEIRGCHRHTLGSGRSVEYISVGASLDGALDALAMVTNDTASGIRHIEVLNDVLDEDADLIDARYLDDAITPTAVLGTSTPSDGASYGGLTIYGLWPHNGKTVQAWLGGLDCGDYTVASGAIFVPYGDGVSAGTGSGLFTAAFASALAVTDMAIGFTYNSDGQIVRPALPAESGARNGPAFAKLRNHSRYAVQVAGAVAQGFYVGTDFDATLKPALIKSANGVTGLLVTQQFTGIHRDNIQDEADFDGMLSWRVTRPYPLNLAAIGGFIETTDV
jgi:hypothetical protein